MKINEAKELQEALSHCLAHENGILLSNEKLISIQQETKNRHGEFTSRWEPSTVRAFLKCHNRLKAQIEAAQLEGKDEV